MVVRIADIPTAVAAYYDITPKEMLGKRRMIYLSRPRQVAMYLSNLLTTKSPSAIARAFRKDHTTVIHALRRIEEPIKHDEEQEEDIMFLTQHLSKLNTA